MGKFKIFRSDRLGRLAVIRSVFAPNPPQNIFKVSLV
nr:MAG TPA: hypothetical protein [Caudoviricetes sp.]